MGLSGLELLFIVLYFLILLAMGFWVKRKETSKDYLIAGRKVGVFQTAASIIAITGGMVLIAQPALAYEMGLSAVWFWIGSSLGMICFGLAAKKIRTLAQKHNFLTISDYFFELFDYKSGILSAIIMFVAFFALLIGQFIAAGRLFAPLLEISYSTAIIIIGIGTLIYLFMGGFAAVIKTDLIQFIIMFVVFLLVIFTIDLGDVSSEQMDLTATGSFGIVAFLLFGIFAVFAGADLWQRIYAAKDAKTARNASFIASAIVVIIGIALTLIGISARNNFPNIDSAEAFYYGMIQLVPGPLLVISVIAILAAIMSTIDTELFLLSSSIAKDFFYRRNKIPDEKLIQILKSSLVVLAIVSMLIAILFSDILLILFGIVSLIFCVIPVIIASLFWKIKNNAVFLSMVAGSVSLLVLVFVGKFNQDTSIITLPVAFIFLIVGQIIFKK